MHAMLTRTVTVVEWRAGEWLLGVHFSLGNLIFLGFAASNIPWPSWHFYLAGFHVGGTRQGPWRTN